LGLSATLHGLVTTLLIFDFASVQPKFTKPIAIDVIFSSPSPGGGGKRAGTELGTISTDAPSTLENKSSRIENINQKADSQLREQEINEEKIEDISDLSQKRTEEQKQESSYKKNKSISQLQKSNIFPQLIATTTTEGSPGIPGDLTKGTIGETIAPIYQLGSKNNPLPSYPLIARKNGFEGKVLIEVQISQQGKIKTILLKKSSGHSVLDHAAMEGVKNWKFEPAKRMGLSVDGAVTIPLIFKLKN